MAEMRAETSAPGASSAQASNSAEGLVHDLADPGRPEQDRRAVSGMELKPLDSFTLEMAIGHDFKYVKQRAGSHELRAGRWNTVSSWSRLIVAFSAAISSVSLLADNPAVTAVFSIATAVVAALTAAFNPPDTATQHRQSAKDYALKVRRLDLLWRRLQPFGSDTEYVEGGRHPGGSISDEALGVIYNMYLQCRSDIEASDDRAPAINRLIKRRMRGGDLNQAPQSWLELRRLKKRLKYRLAADVANCDYEKRRARHVG